METSSIPELKTQAHGEKRCFSSAIFCPLFLQPVAAGFYCTVATFRQFLEQLFYFGVILLSNKLIASFWAICCPS